MYTKTKSSTKKLCECCGSAIQDGDLVYDSGEVYIHDACFFDYIRMFVLDIGWRQYVYGDEEMD
ncbi:MAG: hypothetical protein AB1Z19_06855 [Eubacteriales bacterium]